MKKSTPISRPLKYMYLFMVVVILFSMATMAASAAENINFTDTRHTSSGFFASGTATIFREKQDDSSCYVYNDRSTCSIAIQVYGNDQESWLGATDCSYYSYGVAVAVGETAYIPNLVFERGFEYAALRAWSPSSSVYETINFLWSPDSI